MTRSRPGVYSYPVTSDRKVLHLDPDAHEACRIIAARYGSTIRAVASRLILESVIADRYEFEYAPRDRPGPAPSKGGGAR